MIAEPLLTPLQSRAYAVLSQGLAAAPPLDASVGAFACLNMCDSLIRLEQAFNIGIDVDEAFGCGSVAALLALVEARALAAGSGAQTAGCTVFDLIGYREAAGRPISAHGFQRCVALHPPENAQPENAPPPPTVGDVADRMAPIFTDQGFAEMANDPEGRHSLAIPEPPEPQPDPAPRPSPAPSHPPAERELVDARLAALVTVALALTLGACWLAGYR